MFEHLVSPEYDTPETLDAMDVVGAQVKTLTFMEQLAARDAALPTSPEAATLARQAFTSLTNKDDNDVQLGHVLALRAPEAVRHLVGMLTSYDWQFVEQAAEVRGYVVAKLLEETKDGNGRVRLKALELLGKVTEVALFTERKEITHKHEATSEIEDRVRARLKTFLPPVLEVQDAEVKSIAIVPPAERPPE